QHLAHWAIYLSRFDGERGRPIDEIALLLERALEVSPLNPTARLAYAQLQPPGPGSAISIRSLGLSRDVPSLAWTARKLLAAGARDAALRLYGQALTVAIPQQSCRPLVARFSEDPSVPRYLLPGEEPIREVVRELAATRQWTTTEWLEILPDSALVRLAAARLLREQGQPEAE